MKLVGFSINPLIFIMGHLYLLSPHALHKVRGPIELGN